MTAGDDVSTTQELLGDVGEERAGLSTLAQTLDWGLAFRATDYEVSRCVLAIEYVFSSQ